MDQSQAWIEMLSDLRARRRACAMVVVTGVRGSGPRDAGARMIVAAKDERHAAGPVTRAAKSSSTAARTELVFGTIGSASTISRPAGGRRGRSRIV
jgi:hypothetical protein